MASQASDFDPALRHAESLESLRESHDSLHEKYQKLEDLLVEILEKLAAMEMEPKEAKGKSKKGDKLIITDDD